MEKHTGPDKAVAWFDSVLTFSSSDATPSAGGHHVSDWTLDDNY